MKPFLLQLASDWTGHTNEERLRLCIEALYIHDLIPVRTFNQANDNLRTRADLQRDLAAKATLREAA